MTLPASLARNNYTGDGATLTFAYTFRILLNTDVSVYVDGILKTLVIDYTVTGVGAAGGGNIVFVVAPLAGKAVTIIRNAPLSQTLDYVEADPFPSQATKDAVDKIVAQIQMLSERIKRAVKFVIKSTQSDVDFPEPAANQFIRYNAAATALETAAVALAGGVIVGGVPTVSSPGDAASAGISADASKTDHRHGREAAIAAQVDIPRSKEQTSKNNATTPNSQFDLVDKMLRFRNPVTGAITLIVAPPTVTNNILLDNTNPNGRDQAAAFAISSWVHFYWVLTDASVVRSRSSVSPPATGPTLQAGEVAWVYSTAVRINAAGNLVLTRANGNINWLEINAASARALTSGAAVTFTTVDLSSFVPPNALFAILATAADFAHNVANVLFAAYLRPTGSGLTTGQEVIRIVPQLVGVQVSDLSSWIFPLGTATQIDYRVNAAPSAGGILTIDVLGYIMGE